MRRITIKSLAYSVVVAVITFLIFFVAVYAWNSSKYPSPYPGAKVSGWQGVSGCGDVHIHSSSSYYEIELPIEELQLYYEKQMANYCRDSRYFEAVSCNESETCLFASCNLSQLLTGSKQRFTVFLEAKSSSETYVVQEKEIIEKLLDDRITVCD